MASNIKILRIDAVCEMLSASKPAIYSWMKKGLFPKQIKLGPQAAGWLLADIEAWVAAKQAANDTEAAQ